MPANKSQHFVPRCYLRAFCSDAEGAAINVFNMAREVHIGGAPAKGQCAKPYFYGRDGDLERALQEPEGDYAQVMRRVIEDPQTVTNRDIVLLRNFMLLQSYRSAAWIEGEMKLAEAQRAIIADEATPELLESLILTHEGAIQIAISAFRNSIEAAEQLETRLVINRTNTRFFTSDDPVIYTNRFHLQKRVLGGAGIGSPGAMLLMPLTPHLLLLSFDPDIYRLDKRLGELGVIDRASEIVAFNDLQAVCGHANLYFRDWDDCSEVASTFSNAKSRRRSSWFDVETLQETDAGSNVYAPVARGFPHDPKRRELLHTRRNVPAPLAWPSLLAYTARARSARRDVDACSLW